MACPAGGHNYFLQCGPIACNAQRCISHGNSLCLSVTCWYPIQPYEGRITRYSLWTSKTVFWYQQWLGATFPSS